MPARPASSPRTAENKKKLTVKLKNTIVLLVDEQSLLSAKNFKAMEQHLRECAFDGMNENVSFGDIPIVILFGDDCQLQSIDSGETLALDWKKQCQALNSIDSSSENKLTKRGWKLFSLLRK